MITTQLNSTGGPYQGETVNVTINCGKDLQIIEGTFVSAVTDKNGTFVGYLLEVEEELIDHNTPDDPETVKVRTIVHNPVTIMWELAEEEA